MTSDMQHIEIRAWFRLADLSASIVTLVTLEAFLILVGFLVLDESVALMKHSLTVTALPALLDVGMLLAQMHT